MTPNYQEMPLNEKKLRAAAWSPCFDWQPDGTPLLGLPFSNEMHILDKLPCPHCKTPTMLALTYPDGRKKARVFCPNCHVETTLCCSVTSAVKAFKTYAALSKS